MIKKIKRFADDKKITKTFYLVGIATIILLFAVLFLSIIRTSIFGYVDAEKHFLFEIVFLLLLAVIAETVVVYFKQPTVMILLLLGMILSQSFLTLFWPYMTWFGLPPQIPEIFTNEHMVQTFAQLGAVILMFKIGLHNEIKRIFALENFVVAFLGVVIPFAAGYFYASYTGGSFAYAMFLGAALTATSVGVTAAILKEFGLLEKRFAQTILGAAVIDDILGLLVLAFVINIRTGMNAAAIEPLIGIFFWVVVFLLGGIISGQWFVKNKVDKGEFTDKRFLYAMALVFFYAYVAEYIGLSSIVGAFIAGLLINQSKNIEKISEKTYALETVFVPVFFISLGILVDIQALATFFIPIAVITGVAIVTKVVGCGIGAKLAKLSDIESLIVGFGMSPRGEVALIVALLGFTNGVLNSAEYSVIAAMALLTTLITPPLLKYLVQKIKK
ncbi:MAG: cation:proton antiporter [Candidatus Anstonellales archaeon]